MWPNSQFPAGLVTFPDEILNGKSDFLRSEKSKLKTLEMLSFIRYTCF